MTTYINYIRYVAVMPDRDNHITKRNTAYKLIISQGDHMFIFDFIRKVSQIIYSVIIAQLSLNVLWYEKKIYILKLF